MKHNGKSAYWILLSVYTTVTIQASTISLTQFDILLVYAQQLQRFQ